MTYDLSCLYYTIDDDFIFSPLKTAKQLCIEKYESVDNFLKSLLSDELSIYIDDEGLKMKKTCRMCGKSDLDLLKVSNSIICGNCLEYNI